MHDVCQKTKERRFVAASIDETSSSCFAPEKTDVQFNCVINWRCAFLHKVSPPGIDEKSQTADDPRRWLPPYQYRSEVSHGLSANVAQESCCGFLRTC